MPMLIKDNVQIEIERNHERYQFLKWGQKAFSNFRLVPPGTGICHQVNLEYLGQRNLVKQEQNGLKAYPDTLVGTDSHTTMINGLGYFRLGSGWYRSRSGYVGPAHFYVDSRG